MKILIGTPICKEKLYSWDEYVGAIKSNMNDTDVLIADTSGSPEVEAKARESGFGYQKVINHNSKRRMDKLVAARNLIFRVAQEKGYDLVFFIDSDVIIPCNPIRLAMPYIENGEVWSGFYPITRANGFPTANAKLKTRLGWFDLPNEFLNKDRPIQVDLVGLGCCLVPSSIFKYQRIRCRRNAAGVLQASEDMCFADDCIENEYKVWLDTRVMCKHIISDAIQWLGDPNV